MWPGQKAMKAIRRHMREQTERRGLRGTLTAIVATLNPIIRGWRNDFRVGHSTKKFQAWTAMCGHGWDRGNGPACSERQPPDTSRPCSAPVGSHPSQREEAAVHDLECLWTKVVGKPLRENRTYGLRWRGFDTWPRWNGEPTPPSQERDWKPSTSSRRASPRPYQAPGNSLHPFVALHRDTFAILAGGTPYGHVPLVPPPTQNFRTEQRQPS